jgi:predicted N-acetyltransferase YhbS
MPRRYSVRRDRQAVIDKRGRRPYARALLLKDVALIAIIPLQEVAPARVEALLDAAFGADRFGRTAYRLRAGTGAISAFSFAAVDQGALVGSIQCWPVALFNDGGERHAPLVMVGPVAVAPDRQRGGIGQMLMAATLAAADADADGALMMIGDPEYYGRFYGFTADATALWTLPGPWEPRRLLARAANGHDAPDAAGMIGPDPR